MDVHAPRLKHAAAMVVVREMARASASDFLSHQHVTHANSPHLEVAVNQSATGKLPALVMVAAREILRVNVVMASKETLAVIVSKMHTAQDATLRASGTPHAVDTAVVKQTAAATALEITLVIPVEHVDQTRLERDVTRYALTKSTAAVMGVVEMKESVCVRMVSPANTAKCARKVR